jgi:hypothetical protein
LNDIGGIGQGVRIGLIFNLGLDFIISISRKKEYDGNNNTCFKHGKTGSVATD